MLATSAPPYKLQELLVPRGDCSTPARQTPLGFGIVGVQKGGTTGLTSHISHHPDLCIAIEARVLVVADWSERRGLEWRGTSQCGSLCPRLRGLDDPGGSFAFAFGGNRCESTGVSSWFRISRILTHTHLHLRQHGFAIQCTARCTSHVICVLCDL